MNEPDRRPGCTLITPLYNEIDSLSSLWDSITHQTRPPDEWIIMDNGSADGTFEWLSERAESAPFSVSVLSLPGLTIAQMSNHAIERAAFDVIAGCHGGLVIPLDWLENLLAPLADPEIDVVGGVRQTHGETPGEKVFAAALAADRSHIDERTYIPATRSIAFRYAAWERAGGLPEWLPRFGEDSLFGIRLRSTGSRFALAPKASVLWRPKGNTRAFFRQQRLYAEADACMGLTTWNPRLWLRPWALILVGLVLGVLLGSWWSWLGSTLAIIAVDVVRYTQSGTGHTWSAYWIGAWLIPVAKQLGFINGRRLIWMGKATPPQSDLDAVASYHELVASTNKD